MNNTLKENVILPAWNLIKDDGKIKLLSLFPWLMSILFFSILLVYQSVYTYVKIFEKTDEAFVVLLNFFESGYLIEILIAWGIFFLIYIICMPIYEWWLIQYVSKKDESEWISWDNFLGSWIYNFLKVFKYNNMFSQFKFISLINAYLFIIRFIGIEYIVSINITFFVLFILSTLINVFFAYAKYDIILEKKDIFESCSTSAKIALFNFGMTLRLYFLMFFLNIRVIINFLIFLSFPIAFIVLVGIWVSQFFLMIAIVILSILFFFCVLFLGYMAAVLDVFRTAIWYYAYKIGKENMQEINKQ